MTLCFLVAIILESQRDTLAGGLVISLLASLMGGLQDTLQKYDRKLTRNGHEQIERLPRWITGARGLLLVILPGFLAAWVAGRWEWLLMVLTGVIGIYIGLNGCRMHD